MSFCRNCGNEVSEKAIGCPKCGFDPKAEKKFCYECGTATNEKQIVCVSCGVSLDPKSLNIVPSGNTFSNVPSQKSEVTIQGILRSKTVKIFALLTVLAIGAYSYFSWASRLREGKVEELVTATYLPRSIVKDIQFGLIDFEWNIGALDRTRKLAEGGFFICEKQNGYNSDFVYQVDITQKGRKYLFNTKNENQGRTYYSIIVADYVFGEVTNIEENPDGETAIATYTLKLIEKPLFDATDLIGESGHIQKQNDKQEWVGIYTNDFYKGEGKWKIGKKPFNFNDAVEDMVGEIRKGIGW